jgi:hypothetical protein
MNVLEICRILPGLSGGMKHFPPSAPDMRYDLVVPVCGITILPLLQFDDDRIIFAPIVLARDEAIEPLGCGRDLIFQNDPVIKQIVQLKDLRYRTQRLTPRSDLARRRGVAIIVEKSCF